ncbi:MAG TPA: universal stress protein [Solirubrobacteraceae bacterium]|nr:universal stress protein [Solirubrobacteraceae bacterium]
MERIVVGFDGSEHAQKALSRAADIANGATLAVVAAAGPSSLRVRDMGLNPEDPVDAEARKQALAQAREYLEGRGVNAVYIEGHGNPADVIVQEAQESGADLIVVGTRGLNAAQRVVLGSVSTNVVHHASCDVLVVR